MQHDDPSHSVSGVTFQIFSTFHPNETLPPAQVMAAETMLGFLQEKENAFGTTNLTRAGEALIYLSEAHIPVLFGSFRWGGGVEAASVGWNPGCISGHIAFP